MKIPSWRVSRVELVDPWGWHRVDGRTLLTIREKLGHFESMTWREILLDGARNHHQPGVGQLCKEARERLEEIGYGDLEQLVSLRLSGPERVWGVMEEGVLRLLWWDPKHQVYPVAKKNT